MERSNLVKYVSMAIASQKAIEPWTEKGVFHHRPQLVLLETDVIKC